MIIPGFDILKYFQARLFFCFELGSINQLGFESLEKTFGHHVIPTVAFLAHALCRLEVFQQINRLFAGEKADKLSTFGGFFNIQGTRVHAADGTIRPNSTIGGLASTDFIEIWNKNIKVKGFSTSSTALIAFYDTNKIFISSVNGEDKSGVEIEIKTNEVPEGAKCVRSTGIKGESYIICSPLRISDPTPIPDRAHKYGRYINGFSLDFNETMIPQPGVSQLPISVNEIYGLYDALMAQNPNYITKIDCDSAMVDMDIIKPPYMDELPTYLYVFRPRYASNYIDNSRGQRYHETSIFITFGTHGSEYNGVHCLYNMMKWICTEWQNDVNADALRNHVTFYIMPAANPSGLNLGTRKNANGVDPNRNMDAIHWVAGDPASSTYGGASPGSEYESKILSRYLIDIKPNAYVDLHNFSFAPRGHLFYVRSESQIGFDMGAYAMSLISRKVKKSTRLSLMMLKQCLDGWIVVSWEGQGVYLL